MSYVDFLRTNRTWLFAGFLISFASSFGQTFFIALFAPQVMGEFGLSDGTWGSLYAVATTASAIVMVWTGSLTDRFTVRRIGTATLAALALSCLAMAALPGSAGWALVVVIFALRLTGQGMLSHISVVAMVRWFTQTRGRALSISAMGFAVGQALLPVALVTLLTYVGWRMAWVVAALFVVALIPLTRALLRQERTPQSIATDTHVHGMNGQHWTRSQALRHPLFWLVLPAFMGPPAWGTALFFHQVHLVDTKGWTLPAFVALMPLFTAVTILSTFAAGWLIDRLGTGRLLSTYVLPFAAGFLVLGQATTIPAAGIGMALIALGMGLQQTVPGVFWAEYYGTRHVGAIKAAGVAALVLGSAIGPGLTGIMIDRGMTFPAQMPFIAGYFLLAGVLATAGILGTRISGARPS